MIQIAYIFGFKEYFPLCRLVQPENYAAKSTFPATAFTDQSQCLTLPDMQADVGYGFYDFLRQTGVTILDPPAEYPQYWPVYYAVFFAYPDGLKLEFVYMA